MSYSMPFGALADYATVSDGKLTLVGCFERIFIPAEGLGQPLKVLAFLVARLEASTSDGSEGAFELRLLDEDEEPVSVKRIDGLTLGWRGPGNGLASQMIIALTGLPLPPSYGLYHFAFFVNGQRVPGQIALHVSPPPTETPP